MIRAYLTSEPVGTMKATATRSRQPLTSASGAAAQPALSRAIQEQLGRELRNMYAEIQPEPERDRMADLVKQLERKDATVPRG